MSEWQPIDTAPKDGTAFLCWLPSRTGYASRQDVAICHWSEWGGGAWEINGFTCIGHEPAFWKPLPAPPVLQE